MISKIFGQIAKMLGFTGNGNGNNSLGVSLLGGPGSRPPEAPAEGPGILGSSGAAPENLVELTKKVDVGSSSAKEQVLENQPGATNVFETSEIKLSTGSGQDYDYLTGQITDGVSFNTPDGGFVKLSETSSFHLSDSSWDYQGYFFDSSYVNLFDSDTVLITNGDGKTQMYQENQSFGLGEMEKRNQNGDIVGGSSSMWSYAYTSWDLDYRSIIGVIGDPVLGA